MLPLSHVAALQTLTSRDKITNIIELKLTLTRVVHSIIITRTIISLSLNAMDRLYTKRNHQCLSINPLTPTVAIWVQL